MSVEALSALRQLVQVRDQGESIQNENLEKVQDSVQQVSVSEAQKTDQLFLEKAKAEYEVALAQATVERLQSQEARDAKAVVFAQISTVLTVGLAVADAGMNLARDFGGGQKLKDAKPEDAFTAVGAPGARTVGNSFDTNSIYVTDANRTGDSQTVLRATTGSQAGQPGNDEVQYMTTASITQQQIREKAQQEGIDLKDITDEDGKLSFDMLYQKNSRAADDLFNENGRSVMGVEAEGAIEAFRAATARAAEGDSTGKGKRAETLANSLENKMEIEGLTKQNISAGDGAKYVWNALVSVADTVVPQVQALMAAKERLEQIRIELAAAIEKLAAAQKKLKQIEELITTAGGGDGLGVGNNQEAGNLS